MDAFAGRPDLLLLFVAQIAFIIVQILIYLRVTRTERHDAQRENVSQRSENTRARKSTKTNAKRKLNRAKL